MNKHCNYFACSIITLIIYNLIEFYLVISPILEEPSLSFCETKLHVTCCIYMLSLIFKKKICNILYTTAVAQPSITSYHKVAERFCVNENDMKQVQK